MEEKIRYGITKALFKEFGEEYSIYTESIEQGVNKPCFFVLHNETKTKKLIMGKYIISYGFEIDGLFSDKINGGINSISGRLIQAIKMIECEDGNINAEDIDFEIKDGTLKCYARYTISGRFVEDESELMENLDIKEGE